MVKKMKKTFILFFIFLLSLYSSEIDLTDKNLDINLPTKKLQKKVEDYKDINNYDEDPNLKTVKQLRKEDDLSIDTEVGFDKNNLTRPIDKVKVNVGKKF